MISTNQRAHRLALLTLVVLLLGTAAACGSDASPTATTTGSTPSSGDLTGSWTLETYSTGGSATSAGAPAATLTVASDGTFQGQACNNFTGTWTDDGGAVALELGPMTQMACPDSDVQAQETAITTGFPKVDAATTTDDTLELTGDGVSFTFTSGPEGLAGSYQVTGVNNGRGGVESSTATEAMTIAFADDLTVTGNDGCNSFGSTYTIDGSSLTIGPELSGTLIACPPDVSAAASQFTTALMAVATWERTGTTVTLRDAGGATQITLAPAR